MVTIYAIITYTSVAIMHVRTYGYQRISPKFLLIFVILLGIRIPQKAFQGCHHHVSVLSSCSERRARKKRKGKSTLSGRRPIRGSCFIRRRSGVHWWWYQSWETRATRGIPPAASAAQRPVHLLHFFIICSLFLPVEEERLWILNASNLSSPLYPPHTPPSA